MTLEQFFDINRRNWEDRVPIHLRGGPDGYDVEAFLRGADTLNPIEAGEIGDVSGLRLLHLQCHFGLDTLSLARRGAIVTGLDFSPSALAAARDIATRSGLGANFVESNVYDAPALAPGPFDYVYTTWGTTVWLPDIVRWARVVADVLAPGGSFYFADGHPSALMLEEADGRLVATYAWRTLAQAPLMFETPTTYTGDPTPLAHAKTCEWIHPVSDLISALTAAGLVVEFLREHDRLPWKLFPMMVDAGGRLYRLPNGASPVPLALSLRARKPQF